MKRMEDAQPGDCYLDEKGEAWEIIGRFDRPAVIVRRVDPSNPEQKIAAVDAPMWNNFMPAEKAGDYERAWSRFGLDS